MELRLRDILKEKNKTISSLADDIGVAQANMSNIVNGKTSPSLDTLWKIAKALDKQIGDLFISDEVIGFVKFQGTTYEINSISDIEKLLAEIKGEGFIPQDHKNIRGKDYYK